MSAAEPARLAEVFAEVAGTMVDEFDLLDLLQLITTRTIELGGATAAGLLLTDQRGRLRLMSASDEHGELLELFQTGEGPCWDSFRQGATVSDSDLPGAGRRWPRFAPRAVRAGFRSVHAVPLRLRRETVGALGLLGAETTPLDAATAGVVQGLADVATIGLLQERAIQRDELLTEQLQGALNSRIVVEQAKGVIAQRYGVTVDDAYRPLRDYCHRNSLRLGVVAAEIACGAPGEHDVRARPRDP